MRRIVLAVAAVLVAGTAWPSHALPTTKPQLTDPAGDALGGQADIDVVSALYTTSGVGSGKKYVARKLNVSLKLAGPPSAVPGVSYQLTAMTSTCGRVDFIFQPATPYESVVGVNAWAQWGDCMSRSDPTSNVELITAKVAGNVITWSYSIKGTPLKLGTVFTDFRASVDLCDPVVCLPPGSMGMDVGLLDVATSAATWKMS